LTTKVQKPGLSYEEKMIFVYYLQLQDRIPEAIKLFNTIPEPPKQNGTLRVQFDYLNAYFDFFTG
jgi:hypothetical protein